MFDWEDGKRITAAMNTDAAYCPTTSAGDRAILHTEFCVADGCPYDAGTVLDKEPRSDRIHCK